MSSIFLGSTIHASPWSECLQDVFPKASGKLDYRYVIVGAGIVGVSQALTLALQLQRACRSALTHKILLLDAALPCSQITRNMAGMLTYTFDERYDDILDREGQKGLAARFAAGYVAKQHLFDMIRAVGGDCGFKLGVSHYGAYDDERTQESLSGLWRGASVAETPVRLVDSTIGPNSPFARYMEFDEEGSYNPVAFVNNALGSELAQEYIDVRVNSAVRSIKVHADHVRLETDAAQITADKVVLATGTSKLLSSEELEKRFRSVWVQSVVLKFKTELNLDPSTNYFDTPDIYCWLARKRDELLLLGGGPDLNEGESPESYIADVLDFAKEHFGEDFEILNEWSAGLFETEDGMPIGGDHPEYPGQVYLALGTGGTGNVNAIILALMNTARMLGHQPVEFDGLFNVARFATDTDS